MKPALMKQALLALAALAMLTAGSMAAANAQGAPGAPAAPGAPGGVVNPPRNIQGGSNCRTVITHRTNAMGNRVTVRRRICS